MAADACAGATFHLQHGAAARYAAAALAVLQQFEGAGARTITVAETARGCSGADGATGMAAMLRCAVRELPDVAARAVSQSAASNAGKGAARVKLSTMAGPGHGDAHGSSQHGGASWRPELRPSLAGPVRGVKAACQNAFL